MFGFTGSRSLSSKFAALVGQVVASCGGSLITGCAAGADALVRAAGGSRVRVFRAAAFLAPGGSFVAALVARSVAMVGSVSSAAGVLVGFPSSACPAGLLPSSSASVCFSGRGSGTWASLALAVGLRVRLVVFPCGAFSLPAGWGVWSVAPGLFGQLGGFCLSRPVQGRLL